jgi:3-isopropylmalate/(R)-2-methylmalate dehydratase small subunit
MISKIENINGRGLPLIGNDIDTDRIMPARFLKCITFDGLGNNVFADDRTQANGNHPFDLPQYQGANILVVNRNFGCGSSREHAPQGIQRWGISGIIGESFAEIFFGNCVSLGVLCVIAEGEIVNKIQEEITKNPSIAIDINLESMTVTCGEIKAPITMSAGPREMFISGSWNIMGQLLAEEKKIKSVAANLPYMNW